MCHTNMSALPQDTLQVRLAVSGRALSTVGGQDEARGKYAPWAVEPRQGRVRAEIGGRVTEMGAAPVHFKGFASHFFYRMEVGFFGEEEGRAVVDGNDEFYLFLVYGRSFSQIYIKLI